MLPETETWYVSENIIGNGNITRIGNIAGNGNIVRIGNIIEIGKKIPETEILNICSKRKLIPESEILNIVRIGNRFRKWKFNRKRIVRISIGRGLPDEGPARSRAITQQARAQPRQRPGLPQGRPSARQGPRLRGPCYAGCCSHAHGQPLWLPCVCEFVLMRDS